MASYQYQGVTRAGKNVKGNKEAVSKQAALRELTAEGIFVSDIHESGRKKSRLISLLSRKKKNLADFFFQLSLLLRSGIPLVEALNIIARTTKSAKEQDIILDVSSKVSEGTRFSEALGSHTDFFDPMYVNLVKASERVGRLAEVLMDIAVYEENKGKNADKLKSAIVYPIAIFVIGLGVVGFMLVYIVPKMQGIFAAAKQELPFVTKALLAVAGFVQKYGLFLVVLVFLLLFTIRYLYRNNVKFRLNLDRRLFSINLVGQSIVARFSHILAFQLKEGLPLADALYYATDTIANRYIVGILQEVRSQVQAGVKFSSAVREAGVFPELFPAAVSTGESSGNMPDLLERVSEFYNKKIDTYTTTFLSVIEPLFIVLIGGMVGFVVVAIMLPLFSINTMVQ